MNTKFKPGDIIRERGNNEMIFYVISSNFRHEFGDGSCANELYEWYEYKVLNLKTEQYETIDNENRYDVIMRRFIYEDVKPFMQVLVYNILFNKWVCDFVSAWGPWDIHTMGNGEFQYKEVVPFNEHTKHLTNTSLVQTAYHNFSKEEEVLDFYRNNDLTRIETLK